LAAAQRRPDGVDDERGPGQRPDVLAWHTDGT
jgi:hypothetical protein